MQAFALSFCCSMRYANRRNPIRTEIENARLLGPPPLYAADSRAKRKAQKNVLELLFSRLGSGISIGHSTKRDHLVAGGAIALGTRLVKALLELDLRVMVLNTIRRIPFTPPARPQIKQSPALIKDAKDKENAKMSLTGFIYLLSACTQERTYTGYAPYGAT